MAEPPKLTLARLREIISDPNELIKGTALFDEGRLRNLARFGEKLYGEADGAATAPYRAQITFAGTKISGRCTCMAARSRPYCKHSAGLLVAWAQGPEAFAVSEVAPAGLLGEAKKKQVKRGKTDDQALMRAGTEQIATLIRELAVSGLGGIDQDRSEQVRSLGVNLRENKLRRLSARTIELADRLAGEAQSEPDLLAYAELLSDLLLTTKKLEKHLGGEPLEDRYVEELIGKTWRKADRAPIAELELLEYAYRSDVTPDDFVIRESRFLDLASGEHYAEKQILPAFLAKRNEPKPSYTGQVLKGASGSRYPGFAPHRLDLANPGTKTPLDQAALERLLERCLPNVASGLTAFQERRRDPFAPELLSVALRVDTVLADGARLQLVDQADQALFLPSEAGLEARLAGALRGAELVAVLGEIANDGALPTVYPAALLVKTRQRLELRPLGARAKLGSKIDLSRIGPGTRVPWVETARAQGLAGAAVALGELREELASVLGLGLGGLSPRFVLPLSTRLKELGLSKPAELLESASQLAEPAERLEIFVKVFQVLGIALVRTAGAVAIDRSTLVPVPTYDSVVVRDPPTILDPRAIAQGTARGELNRYQAAVHYARWYEQLAPAALAEQLYPTWADGSAGPFVARILGQRGVEGVAAAERALSSKRGRIPWLTAIRVLEAIGSVEAKHALLAAEQSHPDPFLRRWARRAWGRLNNHGPSPAERQRLERALGLLIAGSKLDTRIEALETIEALADPDAIPYVRMSQAGDISQQVREAAAYTLARLGDTDSVEGFVRALQQRQAQPEEAKIAARALGLFGDIRGTEALLSAWAEAWHPQIVGEALVALGPAVLEPLLDRIEAQPELAERKAALKVFAEMPAPELSRTLTERLARAPDAELLKKALLLVQLAAAAPGAGAALAALIFQRLPELRSGKSKEEKLLCRRATALG